MGDRFTTRDRRQHVADPSGLKPFLGAASVGAFHSGSAPDRPWIPGQNVNIAPSASLKGLEAAAVAVLAGPRTASAGEAVAIAFRGRFGTLSFGLPTAGLSTANSPFQLPDGSAMLLTTATDVDRDGRRYGDKINPDRRVEPNGTVDRDTTLSAAIDWLKAMPQCR